MVRGDDYYDFLDQITLLEGFERVENNGDARQLQKLFWPLARIRVPCPAAAMIATFIRR